MEEIRIKENKNPVGIEKIKLYKDIFGAGPWEEGFICKNCSKIYNKNFMGQCDCYKSDLEPFYKNKDLKETFEELEIKNGYSELVAEILNEKIGFIWGWNSDFETLNKDKLGIKQKELEEIKVNILDLYPDFDINNFYYFAEIGIKNEFRGNDIAGKLYRENLENLKEKGEKYIVVRTTRKSDVPYKWFLKDGYKEIFEYNDEQDRVILVYKI